MKTAIIKNRTSDNGFKILVGGIFMIFGLLTISNYVGYLFIFISLIALFYTSGTEFDLEHKKVRMFQKYFWISKGSWMDYKEFYAISIKKAKKGLQRYGGRTHVSISTFSTYYDVFLMSKTGGNRILLFTSKRKTDSEEFAKLWSEKLGFPIKTYGQE
ncbi:MAG: hypothetical protein PF517_21505 [Salinivirgaceae bacterium]|jgi:hypothetical protein|nr:hypothetical protein [Salinivirgaceae bacterium]